MRRADHLIATALLSIALLGGFAQAQLPSSIPPAQPVVVSPPPPPASVADKPLGVFKGDHPSAPADGGTPFAVDLLLGQFSGIRAQVAVFQTADRALMVEGFYGAILDRLASGEGVGGGARYYFRRTSRNGDNSLLIGPGLGAYYHTRDGVWMAAPTLDLAWAHTIGDTAAFELGLNAGVGIGLTDRNRDYYQRTETGRVTPLFSVFSGFRF